MVVVIRDATHRAAPHDRRSPKAAGRRDDRPALPCGGSDRRVSDFRKLAKTAAQAADDKKALDVVVLDIRKESDIADYLVIAGARAPAQMRAIDESVEEALSRRGVRALHHEGRSQDRWIAIDYGALVVHVFLVEARRFYRLESLWEKAKPVTWNSK